MKKQYFEYIYILPVHGSFVSKRTNERRTLFNRNNPFFFDRIELDSNLSRIGKPRITFVLLMVFFPIGITQHLTQPPADDNDCKQMGATACIAACAPPQASFFLWRRRLGSCHAQPHFGGRRKSKNATHGTATAMQLSSKSVPIFCVFGRCACRGTWPIELVAKLGSLPP